MAAALGTCLRGNGRGFPIIGARLGDCGKTLSVFHLFSIEHARRFTVRFAVQALVFSPDWKGSLGLVSVRRVVVLNRSVKELASCISDCAFNTQACVPC